MIKLLITLVIAISLTGCKNISNIDIFINDKQDEEVKELDE